MFVLHRIVAAGAVVGLAALAAAAAAAPADDLRTCIEASGAPAMAACTRAIGSSTFKGRDLASLHAMRGAELSSRGQHDLALADYDRAIKLEPQAPSIYTGRGNVHLDKGDSDRAIADFDQAIRLDPQIAGAHYSRGNAHAIKGVMDAAIADYGQAIRLDSQFAAAYANRGNAHAAKGDLGAAIADYDQALRLDSRLAFIHGNRGMAYLKLGQLDPAIADYDAALKLDPNQPYSRYGRGIAKQKKGDAAGGNADIAVATMLQPDIAAIFARVGVGASGSVAGSTPAPSAAVSTPATSPASAPPQLQLATLTPASAKAVFEKHNLLGFFARDCGQLVSKDNLFFVNRLVSGDYVQTDQMSGPTNRDFVILIDKAGEIDSNEIVVSGTRDGKPINMLWRVEGAAAGAGTRVRPMEVSWGREKIVTGRRLADSGREVAWLQRCGAPG